MFECVYAFLYAVVHTCMCLSACEFVCMCVVECVSMYMYVFSISMMLNPIQVTLKKRAFDDSDFDTLFSFYPLIEVKHS